MVYKRGRAPPPIPFLRPFDSAQGERNTHLWIPASAGMTVEKGRGWTPVGDRNDGTVETVGLSGGRVVEDFAVYYCHGDGEVSGFFTGGV